MIYIDPHIHCISRVTDDYDAMYLHGVRAVVEPSFWLGQPRTTPGSFRDYFLMILEWERQRAADHGIEHRCTIGLNPKEANDERVNDEVLDLAHFQNWGRAIPDWKEHNAALKWLRDVHGRTMLLWRTMLLSRTCETSPSRS